MVFFKCLFFACKSYDITMQKLSNYDVKAYILHCKSYAFTVWKHSYCKKQRVFTWKMAAQSPPCYLFWILRRKFSKWHFVSFFAFFVTWWYKVGSNNSHLKLIQTIKLSIFDDMAKWIGKFYIHKGYRLVLSDRSERGEFFRKAPRNPLSCQENYVTLQWDKGKETVYGCRKGTAGGG